MRHFLAILAVGLGAAIVSSDATAQQARGNQRALPQRRPSVSPYLNLLNNNNPGVTNYQSLVRPMVNQNRVNAQQSAQLNRLQSRPPSSSNAGNESLRSTGHQATYHYYSHFYPGLK